MLQAQGERKWTQRLLSILYGEGHAVQPSCFPPWLNHEQIMKMLRTSHRTLGLHAKGRGGRGRLASRKQGNFDRIASPLSNVLANAAQRRQPKYRTPTATSQPPITENVPLDLRLEAPGKRARKLGVTICSQVLMYCDEEDDSSEFDLILRAGQGRVGY